MTTTTELPPPATPPVAEEQPAPNRWGLVGLGGLFLLLFVTGGWAAVVVVLAILLMIFLHETGHYVMARLGGMKATEFFLGFGPRIWSFRRGETEFGLKAIPAGAYVKIIGMNNLDEVDPADEHRTYRQATFPRRIGVAVAGSAMHFIIALVLLFTLFAGIGFGGFIVSQADLDEARATELASPEWSIGRISDDSLAQAVGLEPGDRVTAINGDEIVAYNDLIDAISVHAPGDTIDFEYVRGDAVLDGSGELTEHPTIAGRGLLGVSPAAPVFDRVDPFTAVGKSVVEFSELSVDGIQAIGNFFTPGSLGNFFSQVVDVEPDPGPAGIATGATVDSSDDDGRILSIYGAARAGTFLTEQGISELFQFLIFLNIFIGLFNLIPLLPLDGGHVVIAVYERIRSRKGRPYHADVAKLLPLVYAVVFILLSVGLAALYLDITDPVI